MTSYVGDTGTHVFTLVSAGQTFARTASTIAGVAVVWTPIFTDLSGGAYQASQNFDRSGLWQWIGESSDGTPLIIEWAVSATSTGGVTRRQLRRDILKNLGDMRILTATADSMSNVTFIDTINLVGEVGAYKGREVIFTGGTPANLGLIRYITGSSSDESAIGFRQVLPAEPVAGDECEMLNTRGIGYRIADVHDAINQSIRQVAGRELGAIATVDTSYAYGTAITVPDSFVTVEDVQWQDPYDTAYFHAIPKASRPNGKGWWVDRATRTVKITGRIRFLNDWWCEDGTARSVRVWGLSKPAELYNDDDETKIDPMWLIANSLSLLLRGRYYRMPTPETERLLYDAVNEARSLIARVTARRSPFSESL